MLSHYKSEILLLASVSFNLIIFPSNRFFPIPYIFSLSSFHKCIQFLFFLTWFCFPKLASPSELAGLAFLKSFSGDDNWKPAEKHGFNCNVFTLFIDTEKEAARGHIGTMCWIANDAHGAFQCQIQKYFLTHDKNCNLSSICTTVILKNMKFHTYQYPFHTNDEGPSILADVYFAGVYPWYSQGKSHVAHKEPRSNPPCFQNHNRTLHARSSKVMITLNVWLLISSASTNCLPLDGHLGHNWPDTTCSTPFSCCWPSACFCTTGFLPLA